MRSLPIAIPAWSNRSLPMSNWRKSFRDGICYSCQSLADAHPRLYLALTVAVAVAGYGYLLLFPGLVLASVLVIAGELGNAQQVAWWSVLAWLVTGLLAALICYRLYRFSPALPGGRLIDSTTNPALLQLVAGQTQHFHGPRIDRLVLSGDFALDIVKTPRYALPVDFTTTLAIGLPLLQSLSDRQFQCLLARRLGQFSKRYNRVQNWLYQLRDVWPQYSSQSCGSGPGYQPVSWFFRYYAPLYRLLAGPAAQFDELAADNYAMELFIDEDVLDTISTYMVCRLYLAEKYWPVVRKFAGKNDRVLHQLHAGMASVLHNGLRRDTVDHWLAKALSADSECGDTLPSLASRIDNIGFGRARMDALAATPAAGIYLGKQ